MNLEKEGERVDWAFVAARHVCIFPTFVSIALLCAVRMGLSFNI